jgi:hypothetical protein
MVLAMIPEGLGGLAQAVAFTINSALPCHRVKPADKKEAPPRKLEELETAENQLQVLPCQREDAQRREDFGFTRLRGGERID